METKEQKERRRIKFQIVLAMCSEDQKLAKAVNNTLTLYLK